MNTTPVNSNNYSSLRLHEKLTQLVKTERSIMHEVLRYIYLVDKMKAHLELGYGSLFDYLVRGQGYSETAARLRIDGMRVLKELPEVASKLQSAELNLSQLHKVQVAIKQDQKTTGQKISLDKKKAIFSKIENLNLNETESILVQELNYQPKPKEKVIERQEDVYLTLRLTKEQFAKFKDAQSLLSHTNLENDYASLIETMSNFVIQKKLGKKDVINNIAAQKKPGKDEVTDNFVIQKSLGKKDDVSDFVIHRSPGEKDNVSSFIDQKKFEVKDTPCSFVPQKKIGMKDIPSNFLVQNKLGNKDSVSSFTPKKLENENTRIEEKRDSRQMQTKSQDEKQDPQAKNLKPNNRCDTIKNSATEFFTPATSDNQTNQRVSSRNNARNSKRSYIPVSVRKSIYQKSTGRCEYVSPITGIRCGSRFQTQSDHITPLAKGGTDLPANFRMLCRGHNLSEARRWGLRRP